MLAEDCAVVAFRGLPQSPDWLTEAEADALMLAAPKGNLGPDQQQHFLRTVMGHHAALQPHLNRLAKERADRLLAAHRRVRKAVEGSHAAREIKVQGEPDVLGLYLYLPVGSGQWRTGSRQWAVVEMQQATNALAIRRQAYSGYFATAHSPSSVHEDPEAFVLVPPPAPVPPPTPIPTLDIGLGEVTNGLSTRVRVNGRLGVLITEAQTEDGKNMIVVQFDGDSKRRAFTIPPATMERLGVTKTQA